MNSLEQAEGTAGLLGPGARPGLIPEAGGTGVAETPPRGEGAAKDGLTRSGARGRGGPGARGPRGHRTRPDAGPGARGLCGRWGALRQLPLSLPGLNHRSRLPGPFLLISKHLHSVHCSVLIHFIFVLL